VFSKLSAQRLFGFGGYMLASKIIDVIYANSYALLIGKYFGILELGQFNRAESSAHLVSGLVVHPISQVAFPAFSKMRGDHERIRKGLKLAIRFSMSFNAIAMLTLAAVAEPFVLTVLGTQWLAAVPFLQVLCLAMVMMPLHVINLQVLMAVGRSDIFFWLEIIKKILGVTILFLASYYGGIGIAWGIVIAGLISFIVNAWYSGVIFDYGPIRQFIEILPSIVLGLVAATAAHIGIEISGTVLAFPQLLLGMGASAVTSAAILALSYMFGYDPTGLFQRFFEPS
jgi:O-antigen/teichoic acid export membrane protein